MHEHPCQLDYLTTHHLESLGDENGKDADTEEDEKGGLEADGGLDALGDRGRSPCLQHPVRALGWLQGVALDHHLGEVG